MSVFCTSLIKIKIAVDARRVAKRPETCIWVNADDQAVVNRPVVLAVAYGLADVNNAVLIGELSWMRSGSNQRRNRLFAS